jgi:predicted metal-dependent HD superfamily phosphohydrolase
MKHQGPAIEATQILTAVLNPDSYPERDAIIRKIVSEYGASYRKWHNLAYLCLGLREHKRLLGQYPRREVTIAWAYHYFVPGDEDASTVEMLKDAAALGFSLEDTERYVAPLMTGSRPSLPSSSVVGDMRLAILGQKRIPYLAYSRKLRREFSFLNKEAWRLGRITILNKLLSQPTFYYRREFESALADTARGNMHAELALLGYVQPPPDSPELPVLVISRPEEKPA